MRNWREATTVEIPPSPRREYETLTGYRWSRLALYGDTGRQVPSYVSDAEIEEVIDRVWKKRHWLCDR